MSDGERPDEGDDGPTVVGIGTSAGGLSALRDFFANVPEDSGLAFVVVVHLDPGRESHLHEVLQPAVPIPVHQVTETTSLEPNCVYVIPPNRNLNSIDTHLRLSPLEEQRSQRAPIDHFFRTLSETHDGNAVAVVLTGTGSDGAIGIKDVKEHGGLTIAQDPTDAEFDGMPQSAISTGVVDLVLPLADIPRAILDFARTEPDVQIPTDDGELGETETAILHKVFGQLRARTGRDFSQYKRATLMRRIRRRMQVRRIEHFGDYLELLRTEPDEARVLGDDLLITVSSFFRDPEVFQHIEDVVLPAIFATKAPGDQVRVWSVGCATGEEAYSLAMLLAEQAERSDSPPEIQVFASDLHERSLGKARDGFYPGDIRTDVSAERLGRYFREERGGYRVRDELRELVVFAPHNLLSDPPFSRIDLIACRNLLIYLQRKSQGDVMQVFHYALNSDGWLVLGSAENVDALDLFRTEDRTMCMYRKRNVPAAEPRLPVFPRPRIRLPGTTETRPPTEPPTDLDEIHRRLVAAIAPPNLLVGPDERIVRLSAEAGRYLRHPGGELTANVYRLVREELALELRAAIHDARERHEPTESAPVPIVIDGARHRVVLSVRPADDDGEDLCLVAFHAVDEPGEEPPPNATDASQTLDQHIRRAESERDRAWAQLQSIVEEYETSQEELRASNEELQSANEELRSTLEELETSKEELQSMNEELQTVNQENRHKVEELGQLSSDLQNLLSATDIATLFLDRKLRIMRFTPSVTELVNVRATDRGRPLSDLTHRLRYPDLDDDARTVLEQLTPVVREVRDDRGRWHLGRILPYRSTDDRIDGVVITFVDITVQKEAEESVRASEQWLRDMSDAVPSVLFTHDADGRLDYLSRQFESLTGLPVTRALGGPLYPTLAHPEDRATATDRWQAALAGTAPFETRHRVVDPDGNPRWVFVRAHPVQNADGELRWFGTVTDIDQLARAEAALQESKDTLERRVQERTQQVRELAATLTIAEQDTRRRIGQMLHDDLQQHLYGVQMKLGFARQDVAGDKVDDAVAAMADADQRLTEAIELTRALSVDLSPPLLDTDGLPEALAWLVSHMQHLHGLHVEIEVADEPGDVGQELRVTLFDVVRELLFNVAKHAGVDHAHIRVGRDGDDVTIEIGDDGRGFDLTQIDAADDRPGLGIVSIRERLRLLGGDVEFDTAPGRGTRVIVRAPRTIR